MKRYFKMKKTIILIITLTLTAMACAERTRPKKTPPYLHDGFMLEGIDGKVSSDPETGTWYFAPFDLLTDGRGTIAENTPIQILPSGKLEALAKALNKKSADFKFWGKLTNYNSKNYIYLAYYLHITQRPETIDPNTTEPNSPRIIPKDVMAMLRPKRIINLAELKKGIVSSSDGVIIDRTGFVKKIDNSYYFQFDALGRNINPRSFEILNCSPLENITQQQKLSAKPLRYKISAIVTTFNNKNYLLLQRAARAYNHGNFGR